MRILSYFFAYISGMMFLSGILFKVMHWPGASVMLVSGYTLLPFAVLFLLIRKAIKNKD